MKHKLDTAVYAQGWLEGQFENLINNAAAKGDEDPTGLLIATQIKEQWDIVSQTMDDLIKEYQALDAKVTNARIALQ